MQVAGVAWCGVVRPTHVQPDSERLSGTSTGKISRSGRCFSRWNVSLTGFPHTLLSNRLAATRQWLVRVAPVDALCEPWTQGMRGRWKPWREGSSVCCNANLATTSLHLGCGFFACVPMLLTRFHPLSVPSQVERLLGPWPAPVAKRHTLGCKQGP
jgi:hypothetical protein